MCKHVAGKQISHSRRNTLTYPPIYTCIYTFYTFQKSCKKGTNTYIQYLPSQKLIAKDKVTFRN